MTKLSPLIPTVLEMDSRRDLLTLAQVIQKSPILRPFTLLLSAEAKYFPHKVVYLSILKLPNGKVATQIAHPSEVTVITPEESFCIPTFNGWAEPRVYEGAILRSWNKVFHGPIVPTDLALILLEALNDIVMTYGRLSSESSQKLQLPPHDARFAQALGLQRLLKSENVGVISDESAHLLPSLYEIDRRQFDVRAESAPQVESSTSGPVLRCSVTHRGLPLGLWACFRDPMGRVTEFYVWNGSDFQEVNSQDVEVESLTPISEEFATRVWGGSVRKYVALRKRGGSGA